MDVRKRLTDGEAFLFLVGAVSFELGARRLQQAVANVRSDWIGANAWAKGGVEARRNLLGVI